MGCCGALRVDPGGHGASVCRPHPPPPAPPPCHSQSGKRIKKLAGHGSFVNSVAAAARGPDMVASGSDDGTVKVRARVCPPPTHPRVAPRYRTQRPT